MTNLDEYFANKGDETIVDVVDDNWLQTEAKMRLLLDAAMRYQDNPPSARESFSGDELERLEGQVFDDVVALALWKQFKELDGWLLTRVCHERSEYKHEDAMERLCSRGPGGYDRRRDFIRGGYCWK